MNSKTLLISVFVLFVFISGTIYFTYNKEDNGLYYSIEKSDDEKVNSKEVQKVEEQLLDTNPSNELNQKIIVHLHGAVMKEGVYHLQEGSRVYEALELAGGYNKDASKGFVNLARFLEDGESIYFPTIEEESTIVREDADSADDELTNINLATIDELVYLPGIGEAKARSIIAYRTMNGDFEQIEDIMNVSGIKESLFMTIKYMIRV